uniref:Uncharacterized protein n=1 Tax=Ixodes ricinus TaxID=34613 RepID=A0A6B0UA77_IXORI
MVERARLGHVCLHLLAVRGSAELRPVPHGASVVGRHHHHVVVRHLFHLHVPLGHHRLRVQRGWVVPENFRYWPGRALHLADAYASADKYDQHSEADGCRRNDQGHVQV